MNMKRMRGRNHRPNGGGGSGGFRNQQNGIPLNRNHVFDSSGPEMRVRGTAQQLYEKYQQLARDASSNGDRVTCEAYYQHAEHYFRIISAINQAQGQPNGQPGAQPAGQNGQPYNGNAQERSSYQANHEGSAEVPPETRQPEQRYQEPRRFEPRPYEPRNKPEYPRPERNDRPERTERYRTEAPAMDTRIDISSALEAELAAAAGPVHLNETADFSQPQSEAELPFVEARAIPITQDAPPPVAAPRVPRPRGRPRVVKAAVAEPGAE